MKKYENLKIGVIVWQQKDVLTASGEYEGTSNLKNWFSGYFEGGEQ